MWKQHPAQIHTSVTRFKKKKRKLDLCYLILYFFTGWIFGILTIIYLFGKT